MVSIFYRYHLIGIDTFRYLQVLIHIVTFNITILHFEWAFISNTEEKDNLSYAFAQKKCFFHSLRPLYKLLIYE